MKLAVIGTGYVGIVTAAIFADLGNQVWGLDIDKDRIAELKKGKTPIYEPQLQDYLKKGLKKKHLHFTTDYQEALKNAEVIFICVGTPPKKNGDYDLSFVYSAAKEIGKTLNHYAVIVVKSTVPPGTGAEVKSIIGENCQTSFDVASCPEFLREGSAIEDSLHPSRVVIGTGSQKAQKLLLKLHQPIKAPRILCDVVSAQLIKYAANAFLATKISFINSIAIICDKIGADVDKVSQGLGLDSRIGKSFLQAGLGYGGSCFPKDTSALISFSRRKGYDFSFLKEIERINKSQIDYFIEKIERLIGGSLKNKTLTILGLAFKPNTDDLREARSIYLIKKLQAKGAKIKAHDPVAIPPAKRILTGIKFFADPFAATKNSEALLLVTEWPEYQELDFSKVKKMMKRPIIIDGRNFLPKDRLIKMGFIYEGIGR
ncbi:UDP-glucose 6-dehydrogenase [Candidatus Beckwithbacteria bacterium RBG_13_42_9]|uniref:UDP-glucose 6-dehydrogenase n=1 Tax=Candidatus Beckwithbacteria bacterium RBG_13_42_9 TaxID=1797457 RepID=A0A1F5E7X6_9BACT|nr:MAG: UDP-glucose 6-dehydrogenase [Candidatus Beckwithbacteria bacterium RBG_13_42_9]